MPIEKIILTLYGLFLLIGGYFGWRAGSQISLIMGIITGVLVLVSVFITALHRQLGYGLLTVISGALIAVFLMRFLKTSKFMPAGMLALLSLIAFILSISQLLRK